MNRVTLDLEALRHNLGVVNGWVRSHGASLTVVTKALCGHRDALRGLDALGVRSMADSRLENLEVIEEAAPEAETWYLRLPHRSALEDVVRLADVSLNSELEVVEELEAEAARQDRLHRVVIMIELGDLREGILPGALSKMYRQIFDLPHIEVVGIGANLGCLSGAIPSIDQLMQLVLYRELLELKFERRLPLVSAGSSAVLPLLREGHLPKALNHFRVGESILLGTEPVSGEVMEGLRDDVAVLEAEVVEVQEKSLVPMGEVAEMTPFGALGDEEITPGQRGYRALVTVGQVDTAVQALTPINSDHQIAGASSDLTVVNLGEAPNGLKVGDTIRFKMGYSAFVRAMGNRYTEVEVRPPLAELPTQLVQAAPIPAVATAMPRLEEAKA